MYYVYLYVEKNVANDCIKYGIKLSEFADKILIINNTQKKGILAYLSPKDSTQYEEEIFTCLKIQIHDENIFIYNDNNQENTFDSCSFFDYIPGTYENPKCLICSTILPEDIFLYNKYIDTPLVIQNSKEFFYERKILNMLDNNIEYLVDKIKND